MRGPTHAARDVALACVQLRALDKKASKPEKIKNAKGGHRMWEDVFDLGEKIRSGEYKWEDLDLDDLDVRLKWSGLFHRKKRAPGTYMMRLKAGPPPMTLAYCGTPCLRAFGLMRPSDAAELAERDRASLLTGLVYRARDNAWCVRAALTELSSAGAQR